MSFKVAASAGAGMLSVGVVSWGSYIAYDKGNPTGSKRLLSSDYTFNPPKFTKHENLDHGCSENIFKEDPDFDNNKLYGCGVASMKLWDSGNQFTNQGKTIDYLNFNSEISLRKGNKGWKINTRFDNHSKSETSYDHFISVYEKKDNKGWTRNDSFFISVPSGIPTNPTFNAKIGNNNVEYGVYIGNKDLNIKVPNINGSWYKNKDYFLFLLKKEASNSPEYRESLKENFKGTKEWSGIWVEDASYASQWIFQDLEIFIGNKKHSRFFCKKDNNNSCYEKEAGGDNSHDDTEEIYLEGDTVAGEIGTWRYTANRYNNDEDTSSNSKDKVEPIIKEIEGSKGKWVDTKEFCNYGYSRNISDDQLKNLKMFCAKPKSKN